MPPQQQREPTFSEVWHGLPFVTRHMALGASIVFLLVRFNLCKISRLWYFERLPVRSPWTVLTSMLAMKRGALSSCIEIFMFWLNSCAHELEPLRSRADMIFFFGFIQAICLVVGPTLGLYAYFPVVNSALSYLRHQSDPHGTTNLLCVLPLRNAYHPWVNVFMGLILMGMEGFYEALLGIFIGHLFLFLTELLPMQGGPRLRTPKWLSQPPKFKLQATPSFGDSTGRVLGKEGAKGQRTGGHRLGGQRLGSAAPKKVVQPTLAKKNA